MTLANIIEQLQALEKKYKIVDIQLYNVAEDDGGARVELDVLFYDEDVL